MTTRPVLVEMESLRRVLDAGREVPSGTVLRVLHDRVERATGFALEVQELHDDDGALTSVVDDMRIGAHR
ncbi:MULTISPECIES: hypothetical protein [Bacteria]